MLARNVEEGSIEQKGNVPQEANEKVLEERVDQIAGIVDVLRAETEYCADRLEDICHRISAVCDLISRVFLERKPNWLAAEARRIIVSLENAVMTFRRAVAVLDLGFKHNTMIAGTDDIEWNRKMGVVE